jgi:pilus assembly protein CpaC
VPVLGALFRSSSYIKNETDLVIIVTPRLVRPAGPGQQIATPLDKTRPANDPEFFLLGQLEVTKDMIRTYELGKGVVGPYGHMLDVGSKDKMVYVKKQ